MEAVGMRLDMLTLEGGSGHRAEMLRTLRDTVGMCIDRVRHLLFDLYPPELEGHGLVEAVRRYLEGLKGQGRIDYRLEAELAAEPSPKLGTLVYRILQEAITNVVPGHLGLDDKAWTCSERPSSGLRIAAASRLRPGRRRRRRRRRGRER